MHQAKKNKATCVHCQGEFPANYKEFPKILEPNTRIAYAIPGTSYAMTAQTKTQSRTNSQKKQ